MPLVNLYLSSEFRPRKNMMNNHISFTISVFKLAFFISLFNISYPSFILWIISLILFAGLYNSFRISIMSFALAATIFLSIGIPLSKVFTAHLIAHILVISSDFCSRSAFLPFFQQLKHQYFMA